MRRIVGKRSDPRKGVKRKINNVVDELDLKLKKDKLDKLSTGLDVDGKPKPITDNQIKAIIRTAVRKKWMSAPTKLAFIERRRIPDTDPNSRRLWKFKCDMCNEWFKETEMEVDHNIGENPFTDLNEDSVRGYFQSILDVGGEEELNHFCSPCHSIKTVMESHDYTYEQAVEFKKITAWEEYMKTEGKREGVSAVGMMKNFLKSKGFSEAEYSNKEKRRECYKKFMRRDK